MLMVRKMSLKLLVVTVMQIISEKAYASCFDTIFYKQQHSYIYLVFFDVILSATERELTRKLTKLAPKLINGL